MVQLTPIEQEAVKYFNAKALGTDKINRLLGPELSYSVYHHFGLGEVPDLERVLLRNNPEELSRILYELERAQSLRLVGLLDGHISGNGRALDCGSGSGGTAFDLNDTYGCAVHGVNIAHEQVALTNRLARARSIDGKVSFHVMNMKNTAFRDNTFDVAVTNETTMYVDINDLYSELARVLKKGGVYATISWCRADEHLENNPYAEQADRHYTTRMNSPMAYERALATNGFAVTKFEDLTTRAIDYWKIRLNHPLATGVELSFMRGYQEGYLKYILISAVNSGK